MVLAPASAMRIPTVVDPVNDTMSTSGESTRAAPTSAPEPVMNHEDIETMLAGLDAPARQGTDSSDILDLTESMTSGNGAAPPASFRTIDGESDVVFDRKLLRWLTEGEHEPLQSLTPGELHKAGEHEFLNWMVLVGAVTPARADVRYFGELGRINLAAVEWRVG